MKNQMIELAFIRNHLKLGVFKEEDKKLLNSIKEFILKSNSSFDRIALLAIDNCEMDISNGNFKSAAKEINLIHNFNFNNSLLWDSDYFYKIELSIYLANTNESIRIKKLVYELGKLQDKLNMDNKTQRIF